ncbi:MAG: mechanosensitive ion channel family protein [Burkholderiales bacterium]
MSRLVLANPLDRMLAQSLRALAGFVFALLVGFSQCAQAQVPALAAVSGGEKTAPQAAAPSPDLFGRDTPRALATGLVAAFGAGDYERAAQYLEPFADRPATAQGAARAQRLQRELDRGGSLLPFAALSNQATGTIEDGLPVDQERIGTFKSRIGDIPLIARRLEPEGAKPHWVLSAHSLEAVAQQRAQRADSPLISALPDALNETRVGGAPVADWLILVLLAAVAFVSIRVVFALLERLIHALVSDPETSKAYRFAHAAFPPLSLYLAVIAFFVAMNQLQLAIVARQTLGRYAGIVGWVAFAWFVWRLIDMGSALWSARMARNDRRRAMSALVFARRTGKTLLVVFALVAVLDTVGVNVTTGIAALGIGGLALALGAQKTIENLVGSVTVIADEPVRVGDFCKVGEVLGTVEDIGMRSTRIRTNERTVVTIPNGAFSSQQIENYSRRDRFLLNPTIRLAHDTSAARMRSVLSAIRTALDDDEHVTDGARVRFVDVSAYSLDIEIFAYIQTFDYTLSLEMREQVLLKIMDAIAAEGASIALPTQTVVMKTPASAA